MFFCPKSNKKGPWCKKRQAQLARSSDIRSHGQYLHICLLRASLASSIEFVKATDYVLLVYIKIIYRFHWLAVQRFTLTFIFCRAR